MPASRGLHQSHDFTVSKANWRQMKRNASVKIDNERKAPEFGVWCEHCFIRIAPMEQRVAVESKTYHERCYTKSQAVAGVGK
jgi:hypothetical protein